MAHVRTEIAYAAAVERIRSDRLRAGDLALSRVPLAARPDGARAAAPAPRPHERRADARIDERDR